MQQYIRIFLPLTTETKGYEYNTKTPSGRCLLESRSGTGKLILWVQDLKPEALYRVHLIFKSGSGYVGLPICPLTVRPNGKGEARYTFDAANIEGFGMSLDECQALIIIAGSDTAAPLCGYRNEILPWRRNFKKLNKSPKVPIEPRSSSVDSKPTLREREVNTPSEPKLNETSPEMAKETTESEIRVEETLGESPRGEQTIGFIVGDPIKEEGISDKIVTDEAFTGEIPKEGSNKEGMDKETSANEDEDVDQGNFAKEGIKEDINTEGVEEESIYDPPAFDPENTLTDVFKEEVAMRLESNTHIQPFQKQSRKVQWVRISIDENLTLPNHICDLLTKSFVENAFRQYSHLILGATTDVGPKRYYIGVPSLYNPKDKIVGFRQFKCSEDKYPKLGDFGYWLIFMS